MNLPDTDVLRVNEAADLLTVITGRRVTGRRVTAMCRRGLPHFRTPGNHRRILRDDLLAWARTGMRTGRGR